MQITIVGTGYVGLVTGTCLAEFGHEVKCIDIDKEKIENLKRGILPIYETGLKEIVDKNIKAKTLSFSCSIKDGIKFGEIIFSAVGTPEDEDHCADLRYVKQVAKSFGEHIDAYKIFINKSTVPVGTGSECIKIIEKEIRKRKLKIDFDLVSNPEFLREGTAVKDFLNPDRIICGISSKKAEKIIEKVYKSLTDKKFDLVFTSIPSAEIIKYASNSFLATKISFINEVANFCKKTGADITEVALGMGLDKRIGKRFLNAGIGYGGSCFPKDVHAFIQSGKDMGTPFEILEATDRANQSQRFKFIKTITEKLAPLKNKQIAVWGLAFKPETDDMREAPAIDIINALIEKGAKIKVFDPVTQNNAKAILPKDIFYTENMYDTVKNADALIVCTEWSQFKNANLNKIKTLMQEKNIFDGRNIWSKRQMKNIGFEYFSIGR